MEKHDIKTKLVEDCFTQINNLVNDLKALMAETQESANEYGQPKDRYDSYRMQLLRKRDMYGQQLDKAMEEQAVLKRIEIDKLHDVVSFGSVVITDEQKLFISISSGKINIDDDVYYTISLKVPFYQVIKGLKAGDKFTFNNKEHFIKDVF